MLYIVGTPIGNLDDLSVRQAKTLVSSEIILTEDTRSTGMLLKRIKEVFNLTPPPDQRLISYYREKEFEKLPEVLDLLEQNKEVSLISQSGMPLISDPGHLLVKTLIKRAIPFTVVPGPTAAATALVHSGFNPEYSFFVGFLPKKQSQLLRLIKKLIQIKQIIPETVFITYESPLRINATLHLINEHFPNVVVSVGRELTKKFEEVLRGSPGDLADHSYRGEITLVIS